jgi:hypothetical protein
MGSIDLLCRALPFKKATSSAIAGLSVVPGATKLRGTASLLPDRDPENKPYKSRGRRCAVSAIAIACRFCSVVFCSHLFHSFQFNLISSMI